MLSPPPSAALGLLLCRPVLADTPDSLLAGYQEQAQAEDSNFSGFEAARGEEQLFQNTHANDWSCASCHTANPAQDGKHTRTGKLIEPLAPAANAQRFTRLKKTEKWFRRNCKDVLERECTALEKGDILTYLLTIKP
ncbi:MAG: DUF1924 domain-containing protein [Thiolinea sp.]